RQALLIVITMALGFSAQAESILPQSCSLFKGRNTAMQAPLAMSDYHVALRSCQVQGHSFVALREFKTSNKTYLLITDPTTLKTDLVDKSCLSCEDITLKQLPESHFRGALKQQSQGSFPLSNDGIRHAQTGSKGYFLTVDLCPSHKEFEKNLFGNQKVSTTSNFPVAVAISGGWIAHHQDEFNQLKNQVLDGQLNVTWVNHSYTHPYQKSLPLDRNFLLTSGTIFADEVLKQEQYMISNGLVPSVYFRFPGLISDRKLILELTSYGLLSLGSDAWLALGQKPTPGSVILVHGNGNEPYGIRLFTAFLQNITDMSVFKPMNDIF
ncbi:MAG: hypothetical protein J7501_04615, partial [Bdellovibrio sp.]|nr:hypothetical protein [Bdellovibrio sp.]